MDLDRLYHILSETTVQLRKGPEVERERVGPVDVTHVYAMPHVSEASGRFGEIVDCVFVMIGVDTQKAERHKAELIQILDDYPDPDRLAGGPSYIELGGVIGDQGAAFQLFALGQALKLWTVITPKTLGITDEAEARNLAGGGLVMMSGYRRALPKDADAVDPVVRKSTS